MCACLAILEIASEASTVHGIDTRSPAAVAQAEHARTHTRTVVAMAFSLSVTALSTNVFLPFLSFESCSLSLSLPSHFPVFSFRMFPHPLRVRIACVCVANERNAVCKSDCGIRLYDSRFSSSNVAFLPTHKTSPQFFHDMRSNSHHTIQLISSNLTIHTTEN